MLLTTSTAACEAAAKNDSIVLIWCMKIGYSTGAWAIVEQFVALPEEIPAESDTPNKPVCEHEDVLLETGQ